MIRPNMILPFDGNHADIPSGWERETNFDNRTPKGAASGFGNTGGNATHTHSASHVHAISAHTHTGNTQGPRDGGTQTAGQNGSMADVNHGHNYTTSTSDGSNCQSTNISFASSNSIPSSYTVIFIKSLSFNLIPENALVLRTSSRSGFTFHTASEGKFLRGADTGANAGTSTTNATHKHTQSHTHSANAHNHAQTTTNGAASSGGEGGANNPKTAQGGHTHTFNTNSANQDMNSNTEDSSSTSTEPYHKTISHYKADGTSVIAVGDIVMTTSTEDFFGWVDCDGDNDTPNLVDFYIKNHATSGTVAGANTHTHTLNHAHTGNGTHYHTPTDYTSYDGDSEPRNGSGRDLRERHRHQVNNSSSDTANYATTNVTTDEVNNEPPYIKVRFLMATQLAFMATGQPLVALLENTWTY